VFGTSLLRAARVATIGRVHAANELIITTEAALPRFRPKAGEAIWVARLVRLDPDVGGMRTRLTQAISRPARFDLIVVCPLVDGFPLAAIMSTVRVLGERLAASGWLLLASGDQFSDGELLAVAAASGLTILCALPGPQRLLILTRH
jgi:hypothetical protein